MEGLSLWKRVVQNCHVARFDLKIRVLVQVKEQYAELVKILNRSDPLDNPCIKGCIIRLGKGL
jgi:hypothetical protein